MNVDIYIRHSTKKNVCFALTLGTINWDKIRVLHNLNTFRIYDNAFYGDIVLGALSYNISFIFVDSNAFTSVNWTGFENRHNLRMFDLHGNNIVGTS